MPARGGKGTTWTPELERHMLILAITAADLKPSMSTWNLVAQAMGNGITASAVSQKFGKLKKAVETDNSAGTPVTAPSVPASPVTPTSSKTKTIPATAVRKRKAASVKEEAGVSPQKNTKQVKQELENDEEHARDVKPDIKSQDGRTMVSEQAKNADSDAENAEDA